MTTSVYHQSPVAIYARDPETINRFLNDFRDPSIDQVLITCGEYSKTETKNVTSFLSEAINQLGEALSQNISSSSESEKVFPCHVFTVTSFKNKQVSCVRQAVLYSSNKPVIRGLNELRDAQTAVFNEKI